MNAAFLIIDVQRGLFDATPRPFEADAVVERINTVTQRAREAHVPVIFVQHETPGSALAFGAPAWALEPRLDARPDDHRVRKTTPDSFLRTNLADVLTSLDVRALFICGYASEFCVDTTTRSALAKGFAVTLVADAHTTVDKPHATGAQIRAHENATVCNLRSFGVPIHAIEAAEIRFR
ncbi:MULTISPECIES: cysteine hydrolase family protein [unclassified Caballeronia]|uniref:cysteine hydrolase family protein n=1 Tax=unclassified Caballeronia TaxID=2646786 RepID=UPI0028677FDB|nr:MULTISPECIES: cysteine hydrolase family protein [unclassified Caballeronia]MDR5754708.1 cysteine hydrolase family protein [Caballeronia sp. LZ024]MDR5839790.1 cysteine hydrolase family protein [Caballeronia sp. LZ031]